MKHSIYKERRKKMVEKSKLVSPLGVDYHYDKDIMLGHYGKDKIQEIIYNSRPENEKDVPYSISYGDDGEEIKVPVYGKVWKQTPEELLADKITPSQEVVEFWQD
jgi:hypothetical protein